jgi:hypothetical protein
VLGVEAAQDLCGMAHHHVALEEHRRLLEDRLVARAVRELVAAPAHVLRLGAHLVDALVDDVDVCLFDRDLGLPVGGLRHAPLPGVPAVCMGRASLRELRGRGAKTLISVGRLGCASAA